MSYKVKYTIFFAIFFSIIQFVFAENVNDHSTQEESEISTNKSSVNKVIEDVLKDYFIREEIQDSLLDVFKLNQKDVSEMTLDTIKDRELYLRLARRGDEANIRVLDKIYGTSDKVEVKANSRTSYDTLNILLHSCFYQEENSRGESLALVSITDSLQGGKAFNYWLSKTYSHLANFDNRRYSMWLLSCTRSDHE